MNPIILAVFITTATATSYRSTPGQTDSTPFITSIGDRVHARGIAVHPTLLCPNAKRIVKGKQKLCERGYGCPKRQAVHYYDTLFVEDVGFRLVNDVMAPKTKMNSEFDIWVKTLPEEQAFHAKFKNRKLRVWRLKSIPKGK